MTGRNVPLRGIADSTKRESAPPAGIIKAHADIGNPATGGLGRHVKGDVFGATFFSIIQGGIPGCAVKFD